MANVFKSFNDYPEIVQKLKPAAQIVVQKTTKVIIAEAKARAPVDTGLMKKSIYRTGGGMKSSYSKINPDVKLGKNKAGTSTRRHISSYIRRRTKQRRQAALLFPELPPPPSPTEAYVAVAATYGVFVNYGTRRMAARPFWEPAIAQGRAYLDQAHTDFGVAITGGIGKP